MNAYCIYTTIYERHEWESFWNSFLKDYRFEDDELDYEFLIVTKDFPDDQPNLKKGELIVLWIGSYWAYEDLPCDFKSRSSVQNGFEFNYEEYTQQLSEKEFLEKVDECEEYNTACSFFTQIKSKDTLRILNDKYSIHPITLYRAIKDFANFKKGMLFADLEGPCYENSGDLYDKGIIITEFQNIIDEPDEHIYSIYADFHENTGKYAEIISEEEMNEVIKESNS